MNIQDVQRQLDGRVFTRVIVSDGAFGQPVGERRHVVHFHGDTMDDNCDTFFGRPPMLLRPYRVVAAPDVENMWRIERDSDVIGEFGDTSYVICQNQDGGGLTLSYNGQVMR